MSKYLNHIRTSNGFILNFDDTTILINRANPVYNKIKDSLDKGIINGLRKLADVASAIRVHSKGNFYVLDGQVYIKGQVLPNVLSDRLVKYMEQDIPCGSLLKFWDNLSQNPSERSKQDLYEFLEIGRASCRERV